MRYTSGRKATRSWPVVHPKKSGLQKIKNILREKNHPHAKPTSSEVDEPSRRDLYTVALHQGIPFVGFGIMDNAILLLAGEAIDLHLGVALGISTMCAAAIGNIISDVTGVACGTAIEAVLLGGSKKAARWTGGRVTLPPLPKLSHEQRQLRSVRWSGQLGCAVGLTVGCVIGMFPLLFFPDVERRTPKESDGRVNAQLKEEIRHWKERFGKLEREKNEGLWDQGY